MIKYLRKVVFLCIVFLLLNSCEKEAEKASKFSDPHLTVQVGDITPDPALDGDFQNCNVGRLPQYYAYTEKPFTEGKLDFERFIRSKYKAPVDSKESGLLRIRFVVNCKGESGRFRLLGMNENYERVDFSENISDQLLALTRGYKKWRKLSYNGMESDYYFYVTFKLKDGQLIEVLP